MSMGRQSTAMFILVPRKPKLGGEDVSSLEKLTHKTALCSLMVSPSFWPSQFDESAQHGGATLRTIFTADATHGSSSQALVQGSCLR